MALHNASQIYEERCHLEGFGLRLMNTGALAGLAALAIAFLMAFLVEDGVKRFFFGYLTAYAYFLTLCLGAFFFVTLQHLTRAGWSIVVRRIAEFFAASLPVLVILFIPLIFGLGDLYKWTNNELVQHDTLLQGKTPYLNIPFFLVRMVLYFGIWWYFTKTFLNRSVEQDQSGDVNLSLSMETISPVAMILFALTLTFASFDLMMSLDPYWFSTIFGVYIFAGSSIGIMALLVVSCYVLQHNGRLQNVITVEHYHDLGKLLFAFVFFWGYIAFSQYMLIWYGNIPEETSWFLRRQTGGWFWVSMALIFLHFTIPFVCLLSRIPKRRKNLLLFWAVWMLVMHYVDLYWIIMPEYAHAIGEDGLVPFGLIDLACLVGVGGLFIAMTAKVARGNALVPLKDPRLGESLQFENM